MHEEIGMKNETLELYKATIVAVNELLKSDKGLIRIEVRIKDILFHYIALKIES